MKPGLNQMTLMLRAACFLTASLTLVSCGTTSTFNEQNFLKNSKSFVGKFYEILPGAFFAGSTNFDAAMDMQKVVKSWDAKQAMREHYKLKGSFNATSRNLNTGNNSEDSKASLFG